VSRLQKSGLLAVAVLFLGLAWYSSTRPIDFQLYHRVATQFLHGDYELYPRSVYEGTPRGDSHEYLYAPVVAFLFVPFAWLPLHAAAFLFACLKIPAYAYVVWVIARRLGVERRYAVLMSAALLVVGGYVVEEFRNGNFHAFVILLMVMAFDQAERGRTFVSAAALGLAIVAKLTPLALLGYFAWRRRFALCAATLAAVAVLWALPVPFVGLDMNLHLTEGFFRSAAAMADESDNFSLRGALLRTLTVNPLQNPDYVPTNVADVPVTVVSVVWLLVLVALAVAVAVALWKAPDNSAASLLDFSLVLTAILVISPHTQRMHFSMLVVPVVCLTGLLVASPRLRGAGLVRGALAANAAAATLLPLVFGGRSASLAFQAFSPYTIATCMLLVALIIVRLKPDTT
jgi:alpha-1,2-mannosyltransferase